MSNDRTEPPAAGTDADPRVAGLLRAVACLRSELAVRHVHRADRAAAEEELAALEAAAVDGTLVVGRLRQALLVLTAALGSVSALAVPLARVHQAIDLFGPAPGTAGRPSRPGETVRRGY